jgi:hypothetical protein
MINSMDINFVFVLLGINTQIVFLYKREWLLEKIPFLILLVVNIVLLAAGYLLEAKLIGNPKLVIALKMSLFSQLIFISMVFIFRKIYSRDPVDTFWTMDLKLMKDGIFNFVFWLAAGIIPAIIVFDRII